MCDGTMCCPLSYLDKGKYIVTIRCMSRVREAAGEGLAATHCHGYSVGVEHVAGEYAGRWGSPGRVVAWALVMTGAGFACHFSDVGAFPGKGYPAGTATLVGLSIAAAVVVNTLLFRSSALARLPLVFLAFGAYLKYPTHVAGDYQFLVWLGLGHSVLPRLAVALITTGIWPRLRDLPAWTIAFTLLWGWDSIVSLVVGKVPSIPNPIKLNLYTAEVAFLLMALMPPRRWAARWCSTSDSSGYKQQLRELFRGLLLGSGMLGMLIVGNLLRMPAMNLAPQTPQPSPRAISELERLEADYWDAKKSGNTKRAMFAGNQLDRFRRLSKVNTDVDEEE